MIYRALLAATALSLAIASFGGDADARKRYRNYGAYGYQGYYPEPLFFPSRPRYHRYYDSYDAYDDFDDDYYDPYYDPPIRKVKPKKKASKSHNKVSKKPVKSRPLATKKSTPLPAKEFTPLATKEPTPLVTKEPTPLAVAPTTILPSASKTVPPTSKTVPSASKTVSLDTAAKPSPEPAVKPKNTAACDKAAGILSGYGFTAIKASDCTGQVYAFDASRDGKTYAVKLNAASGELTEVRKVR
ncbi:MAG TPA: hypothetical protein VMZ01_06830 [Aestuariivirga sp.]|nr:hypothetical protein [Aestuariivirga sp.]